MFQKKTCRKQYRRFKYDFPINQQLENMSTVYHYNVMRVECMYMYFAARQNKKQETKKQKPFFEGNKFAARRVIVGKCIKNMVSRNKNISYYRKC